MASCMILDFNFNFFNCNFHGVIMEIVISIDCSSNGMMEIVILINGQLQ